MPTSERASWRNPRVLLTLLLVFLAGALMGAVTMRYTRHSRPPGAELSYNRLQTELHLTPQQAEKIKSILDDFVRYNQDLQTQIEDVRATGKNRIRAVLDDGQKRRFEEICAQMQTR